MSGSAQGSSSLAEKSEKSDLANGEDRISNLPEGVISDILSCLPTRDAVRTSVLSKDWEFKWTSIYDIDINDLFCLVGGEDKMANFVNYVERILNCSQNIRNFRFVCYTHIPTCHMMNWISVIFRRNVESFDLVHPGGVCLLVPANLIAMTLLKRLKLHVRCTLKLPSMNYFPNLTSLYLDGVKILNEPVTDTLSFTFSVLETLKLNGCEWLNVKFVEILAPELRRFETLYVSHGPVDDFSINIVAAKLVAFEYCGDLQENLIVIGSSVVRAVFHLDDEWFHDFSTEKTGLQLRKLLGGFPSLEDLVLSGLMAEAITFTDQERTLPRYDKLRRLFVDGLWYIGTLVELLHSAPSLKSLVLKRFIYPGRDEFEAIESVPSCISTSLEEFELNDKMIPISDSLWNSFCYRDYV